MRGWANPIWTPGEKAWQYVCSGTSIYKFYTSSAILRYYCIGVKFVEFALTPQLQATSYPPTRLHLINKRLGKKIY
jgi:hypothetical protein